MRSLRVIYFWILLASSPLLAAPVLEDWSLYKTIHEEEALYLRRIADFWQEGEYAIAKSQMEEFLVEFPQSQFIDPIRVCLGDLLLREQNYSGALAAYSALSSSDLIEKTFLKKIQCLYCLEWYATLADECEDFLHRSSDDEEKLQSTYYLAIALYHQCLNASTQPDILLKLAYRAEPYFQTLLQSDLSLEAAQAFAHLSCILKEYEKAANIYLSFAQKEPELEEEMLYQAALIQTEYDKNLALQSFETLAKRGQKRGQEAAYNHLVLSFEMGYYEQIIQNQESIVASIAENKKEMAHLFFGRSFLALNKYSDAIRECTTFLEEACSAETEAVRSGLLSLIEAARHSKDVSTLDKALSRLSSIDPADQNVARSRLLRALLLKNLNRIEEARQEFERLFSEFPEFPDQMAARIEEIDLEYASNSFDACRKKARAFLSMCAASEWESSTWRYLLAASSRLAAEQPRNKEMQERFANDLKTALQKKGLFLLAEENDWKFFLGQTYFNLGYFQEAASILVPVLQKDHLGFSQEANALLLLGLCYRESSSDLSSFALLAEEAIAKKQNLMEIGSLHLALFNAYLELSEKNLELIEKSAHHLYEAFVAHAEISKENILWLGEWYFTHFENEALPQYQEKASILFISLLAATTDPRFLETAHYRLGQLHASANQVEDQIEQMQQNLKLYQATPNFDWRWEQETDLLLAEGYKAKGDIEKTIELFNAMIGNTTAVHSAPIAKAFLERASLYAANLKTWTADHPDLMKTAAQFKTLILQKNLLFEPIHLEAAMEYVDLLEKTVDTPIQKRLSLLEKIKSDFESQEDLLSKDYHQARLKYPSKNRIYEHYMRFIDEEILMAKSELSEDIAVQKELQAKAKNLLLQIKEESPHPLLLTRIDLRLQDTHVSATE